MNTTNMANCLTVCGAIHFEREGKGRRKVLKAGPETVLPQGRVPLVSRLIALARFMLAALGMSLFPMRVFAPASVLFENDV